MTDIRIAPLEAKDHAAWLPLWAAYQHFYEVALAPAVTETTWARLLDPAEPIAGALAWSDDEAVGLVHTVIHRNTWTIGDTCYLNDLFVVPTLRKSGIGRRLIDYVYAQAASTGCENVYWHTHETNLTAQQLYNRVGHKSGFIQYTKPPQ